ncbi:DUF6254 family protein [Bacillus sp. 1NLA3E]|nr:DUF6254 family protein [Bacillus sp. 1NLA3E]
MTESNRTEAEQWKARKQSQNPHGKVKSFDQLAEGTGKTESKNK